MSSINKIKTNDITYDVEDTSKQGLLIAGENITIENNVISAQTSYTLPVASSATLGGVKVGDNLSIDTLGKLSSKSFNIVLKNVSGLTPILVSNGDKYYNPTTNKIYTYVLNAWDEGLTPEYGVNYINLEDYRIYLYNGETLKLPVDPYTLPMASNIVLGGVKVGNHLSITDYGTLNAEASVNQFDTMPEADEDSLGKIVQYTGVTTSSYTNGYFYKCVSDEATPNPTYSWENIEVGDIPAVSTIEFLNMGAYDTTQRALSLNSLRTGVLYKLVGGDGTSEPVSSFYISVNINNTTQTLEVSLTDSTNNVAYTTFDECYIFMLVQVPESSSIPYTIGSIWFTESSRNNGIVNYIKCGINASNSQFYLNRTTSTEKYSLTDKAETISGVKTFTSLPESSVAPTTDNQFVNKKYVDDRVVQLATLPTASATNLDEIYQYIGSTTSSYTNGYFYQCISDGAVTPTYSWERIDVQPSSGGGGTEPNVVYLGNTDQFDTTAKAIDLATLKPDTIYVVTQLPASATAGQTAPSTFYLKATYNGNTYSKSVVIDNPSGYYQHYTSIGDPIYLVRNSADFPTETISSDYMYGKIMINRRGVPKDNISTPGDYYEWNQLLDNINLTTNGISLSGSQYSIKYVDRENAQTIYGIKTFAVIPECASTATTDYQLTNKKYVDSKVILPVSTMSTASSSNVGKIVIMTATDGIYKEGHLYTCINTAGVYSWKQLEQGTNDCEILMYDGSNSLDAVSAVSKYYTNIKAGLPTVLLLVTDKVPLGDSTTTSPTGKLIVPMSLDTTQTWSSTYRACLIGAAVAYDATDVYFAKQVVQFQDDTVIGLYSLSFLNKGYLGLNDWFYRSGVSEYYSGSTYAVGDYCYHSGQIYVCNTAITVAEAWDASHWTQITYLDYLSRKLIGSALTSSY